MPESTQPVNAPSLKVITGSVARRAAREAERLAIDARIEAAREQKRRRGEPATKTPHIPRVYRVHALRLR